MIGSLPITKPQRRQPHAPPLCGYLCAVLGAASWDLPPEVAAEVKHFFQMCLDKLETASLAPDAASQLLATITGAMVVANALHDVAAYDLATCELIREPDPVTPRATRRRSR